MKALEGVRILDLTHMLSGPYMAMLLADLGAETIKVEPPRRGEGTRKLLATDPNNSIEGMGAYFLTLNRNKKSVSINLKSEKGLEIFYDLVRESDIVLTNFSAGVTERLGIHYGKLSEINPRIITCTVTGFGETGPNKNLVSFDLVAQGVGGGMSITGQPDSDPLRSGIPTGDLGGGIMGTIGVLAALQARHTTGRGQHIDISMQDAQISMLNYMATMYFLSGEVPNALGNSHFVHVPYGTFPVKEGYIIVAIITDGFWEALMSIVDTPSLNTEENKGQPGRWKNRDLINNTLSEIFQTNTADYWLAKMREARIPCAPVNNLEQALNDPHVLARNMVVEVPHVNGQTVKQVGNPIKLSDTNDEEFTAPPLVGQHTEEVLSSILGLTQEQLVNLKEEQIL